MYGYTSKQIKVKAVISLAAGVAFAIYAIFFQESGTADVSHLALYFVSPVVLAWGVLGFLIDWRKILKGIIMPIPLISYLVESFKGLFMAPVALFWALTHANQ